MIELFHNRIAITNPGKVLVYIERFLDGRKSRNEAVARMMRLLGICEKRGSGIDKVVTDTEMFQLPAPRFDIVETPTANTVATLYAYNPFKFWTNRHKNAYKSM